MSAAAVAPILDPEAAVVGCLLHMPAAAALEMLDGLAERDLADVRHRAVVRAVRALASTGVEPGPQAVLAELHRGSDVRWGADSDPAVLLATLLQGAPAVVNAGHFRRLVLEQSLRTRTLEAAARLEQAAHRPDADGLLELARETLTALTGSTTVEGGQAAPAVRLLSDFLAVADEPEQYRVDGLWPIGGRALLAAQYKAGKTTLLDNLLRALVDGEQFLGRFEVTPPDGRVVVIDNELDERMLRRWLREQRIANPERVAVLSLRGRVSSFDLTDPVVRRRWADQLRDVEASVVLFDCLRPVLDALGLSEDKEAGRFLVAFDALLHEAGVGEAVVVHHMGHAGERSRGDSRLRDWPDVEWRLVREADDDGEQQADARRYFSASGRDVLVPEGLLDYDSDSRRLTLAGGTRRETQADAGLPEVLVYLEDSPGATGRAVEAALQDALGGPKKARAALKRAVQLGLVDVADGPRRSYLHTLATPSAPSAPGSASAHPAQSVRQCASAPIGGAQRTHAAVGEQTALDHPAHSDPGALTDEQEMA